MFGSEVLDVVIGLVFIYLLYSLFATILQELIATYLLNLRSKVLELAIVRMLEDESRLANSRIVNIFQFMFSKISGGLNTFSGQFYNNPLIKFLGEDNNSRKPSYITSETFSKVLIDLLRGKHVEPGDDIKTRIQSSLHKGIIAGEVYVPIDQEKLSFLDSVKVDAQDNVDKSKGISLKGCIEKINIDVKLPIDQEKVSILRSLWDVLIDLLCRKDIKHGDDIKDKILSSLTDKYLTRETEVPIGRETSSFLNSVWTDAQGDVDKFKTMLEKWFDETMKRTTGWYKKYTQIILLVVGLSLAIVFNVNTIEIVHKLQKDPTLRAQLVARADNFLKAHPNLDKEIEQAVAKNDTIEKKALSGLKEQRDTLIDRADRLVGEDIKKADNVLGIGIGSFELPAGRCWGDKIGYLLEALLGWFITALAISLGAPFWFDLLNKLMKLRSSVTSDTDDDKKNNTKNESSDANKTIIDRKG